MLFLLLITIAFAIYMQKRDAARAENEHERRKERFERLLEQLKKSMDEPGTNSEKKEDEIE